MENRQPRLERAEEAVQAIIVAATNELLEEGLESITHRRIAERAHANLRSTTYYFKSVKALRREALKLAFGLDHRNRVAIIGSLDTKQVDDLAELLIQFTYGKDFSVRKLSVLQRNTLLAATDDDYADLMHEMQIDVEKLTQQLLDHFGIKVPADRVIALVDGRIFEHVLSGGKTDLLGRVRGDLGI